MLLPLCLWRLVYRWAVPGSRTGFLRRDCFCSAKLKAVPPWNQRTHEGRGTHCAVGVWSPDGPWERTLQKEVLGHDKEAGQCTEEADDICCHTQNLLQAELKC